MRLLILSFALLVSGIVLFLLNDYGVVSVGSRVIVSLAVSGALVALYTIAKK
jgi:hypothetical protein